MTRKEIYAEIQKYNVAPLIRRERGNYTNLSNQALLDYIEIAKKDLLKKNVKAPSTDNFKEAFIKLVTTLKNYRIISDYNASQILTLL